MIKVTALIPKNYNDGQRIPNKAYRFFENKLIQIAGGFSNDGATIGSWMDDNNEIYKDRSLRYIITVRTNKQIKEVKQAVIEIGKELGQKAMYIEIIRDAEIEIINIE
jgi:hypothetical protein